MNMPDQSPMQTFQALCRLLKYCLLGEHQAGPQLFVGKADDTACTAAMVG